MPIKKFSLPSSVSSENVRSAHLGNLALVAGAFDAFGLEEVIDKSIGKEGSHVKANCGALVKALIMQMLHVPYQSLSGTREFYKGIPIGSLVQDHICEEDLGRSVLSRLLDSIHTYGSEKLFLECSSQVVKTLGLKLVEAHIDTTSFHYDGEAKQTADGQFAILMGYSRDHRPDLNQVISLMLADGESRIPFYSRNISGNVNDNKSFNDTLNFAWDTLQEQFTDLKYLVGDSSLCTASNFNDAAAHGLKLVTRVPDKSLVAKRCYASKSQKTLSAVYANDENSPQASWCDDAKIGEQQVRLLLVSNQALKSKKAKTIRKQAEQELLKLNQVLKKLAEHPAKCQPDAQENFTKEVRKLKFCAVSHPVYEEVLKHAGRGRPKKGEEEKLVLAGVKVLATAWIDEEKVLAKIDEECLYVLATNDLERNWSPAELLGTYKRQSVIERTWRCGKDPKFFVDAIYLKKPSRIDALMWLLSLALLVYMAMEYQIRKTLSEQGLLFPALENRKRDNSTPTLRRVFQYIDNLRISLVKTGDQLPSVCNLDDILLSMLRVLPAGWGSYFSPYAYTTADF